MIRIICIAVGYAFGLIQTGYIIARCLKTDIRSSGSGNPGTTNALRTMGWLPGLLTFAGDSLKCVAAVMVVRALFGADAPGMKIVCGMYAGLGAVLGHDFPFYFKFKGGKGVATTAGLIFAVDPWMVPVPLTVFLLISIITRYVSIGSLSVMAILTAQFIIFGQLGWLSADPCYLPEIYAVMVLLALICVWQHRGNIRRLIAGSENKITIGSKKKDRSK